MKILCPFFATLIIGAGFAHGQADAPNPATNLGPFADAREPLREACLKKDFRVCSELPDVLRQGTAQDQAKGLDLTTWACNQSAPFRCHALGMFFHFGNGVDQDPTRAANLFARAT